MPIEYDYSAKGRADALAGLRDDKLYGIMAPHGEAYRTAHRLARIGATPKPDGAIPRPAPIQTASDDPPWGREAEVVGSPEPANCAKSQTDLTRLTDDAARRSASSDVPSKSKPAPAKAAQLDLFG